MMDNNVLLATKLSKRYGKKVALHNFDFELSKGECVGLIGQNGAGKSTFMSIVTGLILNYDGDVRVLGENVKNAVYRKKVIGSMIENPVFFGNMSGIDNLKYCASMGNVKFDYENIRYYVEKLELEEVIDQKVKTYSLGMKKKLDFIQAIMGMPEIVLLDEPTNGLDPLTIPNVRNIVSELTQEGCSIIIASHQLAEISKMCNRVVIIHKGHLIGSSILGSEDNVYLEKLYYDEVEKYEKSSLHGNKKRY